MANLSITAADVHMVQINGESDIMTGPCGEAVNAGQYVRRNTTTGHFEKGNASSAGEARDGGIALQTAAVGDTMSVQRGGIICVGNALSALAYDADVFLSDTDATLADAAGTVSKVVGTVFPAFGTTTPDKLLLLKDL